MPVLALAGADCERLGGGPFAQPMNTVSGVAFILVGAWIVVRAFGAVERRVELAVFGLAIASNAVGGLLFHGLQTQGARWVHDVSILSVLLFIVVFDVARFFARTTVWTMAVYTSSLAAIGVLLASAPSATDASAVVLGVAAGGWEIVEYRHELPTIRAEGLTSRRAARLGVLVALALGATAFLVGRTGGWLCSPESVFQWHAVWHLLAAAAMGLYAYGAIEPHAAPVARSTSPRVRDSARQGLDERPLASGEALGRKRGVPGGSTIMGRDAP